MIKVHILTDDRVRKKGYITEHGLSLWIEKDGTKILFDSGQTSVYCNNAVKQGIRLEEADYIVISHGHYDHCGGLLHFPENSRTKGIFVHQDAFRKKFATPNEDEPFFEVGLPFELSEHPWLSDRIVPTKKPMYIGNGLLVSGEIPRTNSFEEVASDLYLEEEGKLVPDGMRDEQMLLIEDNGELALILGCSHPGIINSINYAKELFPDKKIKLLIAGMHLEDISHTRLQLTIEELIAADIRLLVPMHCTGLDAICAMKHSLGDRCRTLCTGDVIRI